MEAGLWAGINLLIPPNLNRYSRPPLLICSKMAYLSFVGATDVVTTERLTQPYLYLSLAHYILFQKLVTICDAVPVKHVISPLVPIGQHMAGKLPGTHRNFKYKIMTYACQIKLHQVVVFIRQ